MSSTCSNNPVDRHAHLQTCIAKVDYCSTCWEILTLESAKWRRLRRRRRRKQKKMKIPDHVPQRCLILPRFQGLSIGVSQIVCCNISRIRLLLSSSRLHTSPLPQFPLCYHVVELMCTNSLAHFFNGDQAWPGGINCVTSACTNANKPGLSMPAAHACASVPNHITQQQVHKTTGNEDAE